MNKTTFNGIVRNTPDSTSQLGECQEMINVRPNKDGTLRVIAPASADFNAGIYDKIYIHRNQGYEHFIGWQQSSGKIDWFEKTSGAVYQSIATISGTPDSVRFGQLNNFLFVLYEINGVFQRYTLFFEVSGSGGQYRNFNADVPQVPRVQITNNVDQVTIREAEVSYPDPISFPEDTDLVSSMLQGAIAKVQQEQANEGVFEGWFAYVCAFRLFDGSYVGHTIPKITRLGVPYDAYPDHDEMKVQWVKEKSGKTIITVKNINAEPVTVQVLEDINASLGDYKDIILSLDIFISRPMSSFIDPEGDGQYSNYTVPELSDIAEDPKYFSMVNITKETLLEGRSSMYRVKSIPIEEVTTGFFDVKLDLNNLTSLETLPVDEGTHHQVGAKCITTYNASILLGNTQTRFNKGFSPRFFGISSGIGCTLITHIKTSRGICKVESEEAAYGNQWGSVIGYPDSRAFLMEIKVGGTARQVPLTPHPIHNYAYYANEDLKEPINFSTNPENSSLPVVACTSPSEAEGLLNEPNRVQGSAMDNPLFFPAKYSYRTGSGSINILAANSQPMHGADFGGYPIYALTDKGIWTLKTGVDMLVTNVVRTSREVAISEDAVYVDGGIVFATEKNVTFLQGSQPSRIGEALISRCENKLIGNADYSIFTEDARLVQLASSITDEKFTDYITGAKIGYIPIQSEIIISNPNENYSYLYSLEENKWYKSSGTYNYFISDYPNVYAEDGGVVYDLQKDDQSAASIFIQTRPAKLTDGLSQLKQLVVDCHLVKENYDAGKYIGLYIFASNDEINWKFIDGIQTNLQKVNNLYIGKQHSSYKYYIFILAGQVDNYNSTNVNYLSIDAVPVFDNKQR